MKKNLTWLIVGFMCIIVCAQKSTVIPGKDTQLKITYSIEYKKLPFKMKMMKKMLPTESVSYYSCIGNRSEININGKIMGQSIMSSTVMTQNYSDSTMSIHVNGMINDSIIDDVVNKIPIPKKSISKISFEEKEKEILGYSCVYFISENDSIKTEGYLTKEIDGIDEFKNHGMPLDYVTTNKKEKSIVITKAKNISIEVLDKSKFIVLD